MSRRGYVYVLANEGMPGLRKIGRCIDGGRSRARQLYQTGVPHPFTVEFEMLTDDPEYVEETTHESLKDKRVNGSREFFSVDLLTARQAVIAADLSLTDERIVSEEDHYALCNLAEIAGEIGEHFMIVFEAVRFLDRAAVRSAVEEFRSYCATKNKNRSSDES